MHPINANEFWPGGTSLARRGEFGCPMFRQIRGAFLYLTFAGDRRAHPISSVNVFIDSEQGEYTIRALPRAERTQRGAVPLLMPRNLRRFYGRGDLHFITFTCYRRRALLGTAKARNAFVDALREVRSKYKFALAGYVIMPEHVHLLIGEPKIGNPSTVIHSLKLRVSKRLRRKRRNMSSAKSFSFLKQNPDRRPSGTSDSTTSTFTAPQREEKNSNTCTVTR